MDWLLRQLLGGPAGRGSPTACSPSSTCCASARQGAQAPEQRKCTPAGPLPIPEGQRHKRPALPPPDPAHAGACMSAHAAQSAQVLLKIQALLQAQSALEAKIMADGASISASLCSPSGGNCSVEDFAVALATALAPTGCRVVVRQIVDRSVFWAVASHTFVLCVAPSGGKTVGIVVDPNFKQQFVPHRSTLRYREVWSALPDVFVGQVAQLLPLVRLLCNELSLLYESHGGVLPPWRTYNAFITRWMSKSCSDRMVPLAGMQATQLLQCSSGVHQAHRQHHQQAGSHDGNGIGIGGADSPSARGARGEDRPVIIRGFEIKSGE